MTGCVQGIVASYGKSTAAPVSGKFCTSAQVSLACCTSTGVCADAAFGLGATCSPAVASGPGTWDPNC